MTDPQQAARIAAMRARRGQAPVEIAVTNTSTSAVENTRVTDTIATTVTTGAAWAPPAGSAAPVATPRTRPVDDAATIAHVMQERPVTARTARTSAKQSHVAAGARIIVTGLTASAVFGITTVIAAANRPIVPATDSQVAGADGTAAPSTLVPATLVPATLVPATTVPATAATTVPATAATTVPATPAVVVLTLPTTVAPAAPAPAAPATPTPASAPKPATPAPAQTPAPAPAPAPVQTAAPAPVTTQPAPAATSSASK